MTAQAGDTIFTKAALRKQLRSRRTAFSAAQRRNAAHRAAQNALRFTPLRKARHIAVYFSHGSELDTAPLLRALMRRSCTLHAPKLSREGMHFVVFDSRSALRRNRHGIREPLLGARRYARKMDVILLPLLGFDRQGTRLGTGGGFYDRALAFPRSFRRPQYVGYAYALQELESLPRDSWDVRLDAVITDKGILRCSIG